MGGETRRKIESDQQSDGRDGQNDEFVNVEIRIAILGVSWEEKNSRCEMESIVKNGKNRKIISIQFGGFRMNGFGRKK